MNELLGWLHGKKFQIDVLSFFESLVKAIKSSKAVANKRTDVQFQSMRDDLEKGVIRSMLRIDGKINPADTFTKDTDGIN